ncbi:MAG: acetyl-CoA carboxylase [Actinomycetota bacterium]|nr:acetyl-CoA carboxylase [Actinomycetota bacterium]
MAEHTIRTSIPGTFYRRPTPDAEPFVAEGATVSVGDVVGLVEIMKSFHEIKSEKSGTLQQFLVESDDPVEAGQDIATLSD